MNDSVTIKGIVVTQSLAILMDPIEAIKIEKDSSFAMLLEAQQRGWKLHYLVPDSLFAIDGIAYARSADLSVMENSQCWHQLGPTCECALGDFDVILMRKDPPFNMEFVYISLSVGSSQRPRRIGNQRP
jgi:glutathione synthase